jgi:anti-sigma factor RsiW
MSCTQTMSLGAYLLGSLDPGERWTFERHLGDCTACNRELVRLAPLPGLLGQINLSDLQQPYDPEPYDLEPFETGPIASVTLLPAVREPEPPPKRKRGLLVGAGLVLALLIAAGVVVPRFLKSDDPVPPAAAVTTWSATDAKTGVAANAALTKHPWGTEVVMELDKVPPGLRCKLVMHDKSGKAEVAGWWGSSSTEGERIPGSTSFAVDQIDYLEVVADMRVLVTVRPVS